MANCLNTASPAPLALACAAALAGLFTVAASPVRAENITLVETGSTLIYPLFNVWASEYAKTHQGVHIATNGTGSGVGIEQAISGEAQIGASDAYMSDAQIKQNPQIVNIALAISAMTVNYNLPELKTANLKLDGPVLTGIYTGKIRSWDDKAIKALNPDVALPHHDIIPVHRADRSGDTFVFTQYLSFSSASPWEKTGPSAATALPPIEPVSTASWENRIGYGTTIAWPSVEGALSAIGNLGVVQAVQQNPYAIGYIGVSFHGDIEKAAIGTAALKSYSGEFLLPTPETIKAAAAALTPRTPPDERLTLVNAPGENAYPLVNYEYAIVSTKQPNPETAAAIRKFLLWAIAPCEQNEKYLADAEFIPLPAHIWVLSHDQIESIR